MSDSTAPAVAGNASPPSDLDRLIPCRAGLRPVRNSPQNEIWVQSPRTGKIIVIWDGWFGELAKLAPRLKSRIVHACSNGQPTVHLSVAELTALAAVQKI